MTCASPQILPSDDASTPRHNGLGLGEGYGMKGGGRQQDGAIKNTAGKLKDEGLSTQSSGRGERRNPRVTALASILLILQNSYSWCGFQPASPEPLGKVEPRIYREMGGKPSVTMMRPSDDLLDQASKDRYRTFLASKINRPEPTAALERKNPPAADDFYELSGTWLRENTRDMKKFSILFNELATYGFRRNLFG
jgi:hypothetical protein